MIAKFTAACGTALILLAIATHAGAQAPGETTADDAVEAISPDAAETPPAGTAEDQPGDGAPEYPESQALAMKPSAPGTFDLAVRLIRADPASGTVEISLFDSEDTFLKEPFLQASGPVKEDGTHTALFKSVPPGEYAVVVVHDENDNGELDAGFFGFFGETYAFSNDARPLFGRPEFDEAKFSVSGHTVIQIRLD